MTTPNSMICDTPEALRFLASAAKQAEREWMRKAADEIERLRITPEERASIQWVVGDALSVDGVSIQTTLRGLLARHDAT